MGTILTDHNLAPGCLWRQLPALLTENHSFSWESQISLHLLPSLLSMLRARKKHISLHTWDSSLQHLTVKAFAKHGSISATNFSSLTLLLLSHKVFRQVLYYMTGTFYLCIICKSLTELPTYAPLLCSAVWLDWIAPKKFQVGFAIDLNVKDLRVSKEAPIRHINRNSPAFPGHKRRLQQQKEEASLVPSAILIVGAFYPDNESQVRFSLASLTLFQLSQTLILKTLYATFTAATLIAAWLLGVTCSPISKYL